MRVALDYIKHHPGCSIAEVDRACRTARGGHQWMYLTVKRLVSGGFVKRKQSPINRNTTMLFDKDF